MKIVIAILTFFQLSVARSQDSTNVSSWRFLDQYRISAYGSGFLNRSVNAGFWGGNEIEINLVSYQTPRQQLAVSTGMFFINVKSQLAHNPSMQYFYFPIGVSYRLYSKSRKVYGETGLSRPMVLYQDSKYINYDKFWLQYENAFYTPNYVREKIYAIHTLKFGYCIGKHFTLDVGEITYLFSTSKKRFNNLTQLSFGVGFKL